MFENFIGAVFYIEPFLTFQSSDFPLKDRDAPDWTITKKLTDHALCFETLSCHSANASQTHALRQHSRTRREEKEKLPFLPFY